MKKTEKGLGSSKEVKERDVVDEMVEAIRAAWKKAIEYQEAHIRKTSAMASGRKRDVVGEMEEKDGVNQIEEYLNEALMLIKNCKARTAMSSAMAGGRTQIQAPESDTKNLQLRLLTSLPEIFYTGNKAVGKSGFAIQVKLIDKSTGHVVTSGSVSCARLHVVAVEGNFDYEDDDDWALEYFNSHVAKDRDGKKPLTGNLELSLKDGVGSLEELAFTDNSSCRQNKKIRLGVKVAPGFCEGIRVREAISDPLVVKDRRGEGCKKHDLPAPDDEVWRLRNIGKHGPFHKRLNEAGIFKVRDFLWKLKLSKEPLRKILGTTMSMGKWETLVEHAETCDLSGKYYVYYADNMKSSGVVFKNIFEISCLIEGEEYYSAENFSDSQKESADELIREACDNACCRWKRIEEYIGQMPSDMKRSKRARFSPTDVATGAHTDPQVRGPAIGDPPVSFEQQVPVPVQSPSEEQDYENPTIGLKERMKEIEDRLFADSPEQADGTEDLSPEWERVLDCTTDDEPQLQPAPDHSNLADGTNALPVEDPPVSFEQQVPVPVQSPSEEQGYEDPTIGLKERMKEIEDWLSVDYPEQADGTDDLSPEWTRVLDCTTDDEPQLQPAPDHSNLADGTNGLSVEDCDSRMPIDMNPRERERFPPTDRLTWADFQTWADENCGMDQQGTPVASRDQALVNQWPDVGDPPVPFDQQAPLPCQQHSGHFEDRHRMVGADIQGEL